jgi:hypothetical protein
MSIGVLVLRAPPPIPLIKFMLNFIEASMANLCVYYSKSFIREFTKRLAET